VRVVRQNLCKKQVQFGMVGMGKWEGLACLYSEHETGVTRVAADPSLS
jgi:hypothetical protein